jgi:hypothetical protein
MGGGKPDYRAMAMSAGQSAGLDPDFVGRLVDAESGGKPYAMSPKGAMGLMQVMPATAKQYGVTNLMDPSENIKAGIGYLKDLTAKYPNRPDLVAAAYNAGPGAVDKAGGVPPFKETQAYVKKVAPSSGPQVGDDVTSLMGGPAQKDKGETIYSNSPQTGGSSIATAIASKAVPAAQATLEEFGTNPNVMKLGSKIGRVIGGVAPTAVAAAEGSPYGVLTGLALASRTAWAGGKTGWFTAKLAQDLARPLSRLAAAAGPMASVASAVSGVQGALDLSQMAPGEDGRQDVGFLGVGSGPTTADAARQAPIKQAHQAAQVAAEEKAKQDSWDAFTKNLHPAIATEMLGKIEAVIKSAMDKANK